MGAARNSCDTRANSVLSSSDDSHRSFDRAGCEFEDSTGKRHVVSSCIDHAGDE
jgi:hypothetical protein